MLCFLWRKNFLIVVTCYEEFFQVSSAQYFYYFDTRYPSYTEWSSCLIGHRWERTGADTITGNIFLQANLFCFVERIRHENIIRFSFFKCCGKFGEYN